MLKSILISDNGDFRGRRIFSLKDKCHVMIKGSFQYEYITKPKYICTKQQGLKIYEGTTDKTERRNRKIHNYS